MDAYYHVSGVILRINKMHCNIKFFLSGVYVLLLQDHADREWKFARSKLWMGYFDDGSTLPPPFNLIISPKSIFYFLRGIKRFVVCCFCGNFQSSQYQARHSSSAAAAVTASKVYFVSDIIHVLIRGRKE